MFSLQKKIIFFHSPIFHWKIHKRRKTFFERAEGNSLKRTYADGEWVHVKLTRMNKGEVKN